MKKTFFSWASFQIIEAALLIAVGIVTFVFAANENFWYILGFVMGIGMIVDSFVRLILEFVRKPIEKIKIGILVWVFELGFGIFAMIIAKQIIPYLCLIISIMMIIIGIVLLIVTILKSVRKDTSGLYLFTGYLSAILLTGLGVAATACYPYSYIKSQEINANVINTIQIMLICLGAVILILAIVELILTVKAMVEFKNNDKNVLVDVKVNHKEKPKQVTTTSKNKSTQKKDKGGHKLKIIEAEVIEPKKK